MTLRFTFTPNDKREFVPRDQVFPLIVVYCLLESFRFEFTANLQPLEVTWQVFRVTFEVYDVRFQRGEVGFHVCHLRESF